MVFLNYETKHKICFSKCCYDHVENVQIVLKIFIVYLTYSETYLKRTPLGPKFLSALDRCPLQTGQVYETLTSKLKFWDKIFCLPQAGVRFRVCPLKTCFTVFLVQLMEAEQEKFNNEHLHHEAAIAYQQLAERAAKLERQLRKSINKAR